MLCPRIMGTEKYEVSEDGGAKAFSGSGFNPQNPQHWEGSDAVRWAISLQQMRDAGDFVALDAARLAAERFFYVMQERDGTRLMSKPVWWHQMTSKALTRAKAEHRMPVVGGVILDGAIHYV